MSTQSDNYQKGLALFSQRVQDLLGDGYHVVVKYEHDDLCLAKLRHHNGNKITLKFNVGEGIISQLTNHIQNYRYKVY